MIFFISLLIAIITHELGHLFVAKICHCRVYIFSLGFGKPILWSKKIGKTKFQITPWILGGFCELDGETDVSNNKYAFINLPVRKKVFIALAGIIINLLLGLLAISIGLIMPNYIFLYFGLLSFWLGLFNAIPILPCLDGGYAIIYPLILKIYGKQKGINIFAKISKISFKIIMVLNILSIPILIWSLMKGYL